MINPSIYLNNPIIQNNELSQYIDPERQAVYEYFKINHKIPYCEEILITPDKTYFVGKHVHRFIMKDPQDFVSMFGKHKFLDYVLMSFQIIQADVIRDFIIRIIECYQTQRSQMSELNPTVLEFLTNAMIRRNDDTIKRIILILCPNIDRQKIVVDGIWNKIYLCERFFDIFRRVPFRDEIFSASTPDKPDDIRKIKIHEFVLSRDVYMPEIKKKIISIFGTSLHNMSYAEFVDLCSHFYSITKSVPLKDDTFMGVNIGKILYGILSSDENHLDAAIMKSTIKNIFDLEYTNKNEFVELLPIKYEPKPIVELSNAKRSNTLCSDAKRSPTSLSDAKRSPTSLSDDLNSNLQICRNFFNKYKRLPRCNEIYEGLNIGKFYWRYFDANNSDDQNLVIDFRNIFGAAAVDSKKLSQINTCKLFMAKYGRAPDETNLHSREAQEVYNIIRRISEYKTYPNMKILINSIFENRH